MTSKILSTRRGFIKSACAGSLLLVAPSIIIPNKQAFAKSNERFLNMKSIHTGESIKVTYWEEGKYIPDALDEINHFLRDHRNGQVKTIDKKLLDDVFELSKKLELKKHLNVISGYRSPETNKKLRKAGRGVAKRSLHMQGKAIDIRPECCSLNDLHKAAIKMKKGGVGKYTKSCFVHMDTGRVRRWGK